MGRKNKNRRKPNKVGQRTVNKASLRAEIMSEFRSNPGKVYNYKQMSARLNITMSEGRKLVLKTLNELVDIEMLVQPSIGKFEIHPSQVALLKGKIEFLKSGAAYVQLYDSTEEVFVSNNNTGLAFHGDDVEVSIIGWKRGKPEGKVSKVVERNKTQFVGVLEVSPKHAFVISTSQRDHTDFFVDRSKLNNAENGDKVIVKFLDWTDPDKSPFGEIIAVLGKPGLHETEMHAIMAEFGLPFEFPEAVEKEASQIDVEISEAEIAKRKDFRKVTTFTIDPHDAKDFDDALSLRKIKENRYEVGIHIADVSHYVQPNDIIDKEARQRATSVYLVDRVIPMLPEVLSNLVCSLRPKEDKLCMSAVFELNEKGEVLEEWFGKTVIHSDRRFTYEEAQEIIEGADGDFKEEILQLHAWASDMRKQRMNAGALEFGGVEVKFNLDDDGKPTGVYKKVLKEANFLIEEFMLLANRRVAQFVGKPKSGPPKPFIYRVHDLPDPDKLKILKDFVHRLGYKLKSARPEHASEALNELMQQVKGKTEEDVIKQMAIRAMAKATYETENIGHYGLAFDFYTHFTSPIRRYPDLIVHRLIDAYSKEKAPPKIESLDKSCKHSSYMEKMAAEAERSSIKYKQVEFMLDKIGSSFQGVINGMNKWGIFVELVDTKIEGMIPLSTMDDDRYRYDEKTNRIIGIRYKEVFEFGDPINVELFAADISQKQLEFRML